MSVHSLKNPTLQDYIENMVGRTIIGAGIIDDEFHLTLDDASVVMLFSDNDLNLYVEYPELQ